MIERLIAQLENENQELRSALAELVRLKDLKVNNPTQYDAEGRAKGWAWDKARALLLEEF